MEDFDLLASHDLGKADSIPVANVPVEEQRVLIWQQVEPQGYHPATRQVIVFSVMKLS